MRPMTGFEGAIGSRFEPGQGWIAWSQVLLAMTDDRRACNRQTHPAAAALNAALLCPSTLAARTLPRRVFSAEYFPLLRGNRRFRGVGSATRLPPKSPVLPHGIHRYGIPAAGSPHAGRKPARFPVSRLSA
jgi:hypothetical protein